MKRHAPRRQRNSTVYTGLVGAKLRPRRFAGYSRRVAKMLVRCTTGPWLGYSLALSVGGDMATLPIVIRGAAGCYVGGAWRPAVSQCLPAE